MPSWYHPHHGRRNGPRKGTSTKSVLNYAACMESGLNLWSFFWGLFREAGRELSKLVQK